MNTALTNIYGQIRYGIRDRFWPIKQGKFSSKTPLNIWPREFVLNMKKTLMTFTECLHKILSGKKFNNLKFNYCNIN